MTSTINLRGGYMKKLFITLGIVFAVVLISVSVLFFMLEFSQEEYVKELNLVAPDNSMVIVIRERDYLANTGADIYIKDGGSLGRDKHIGSTTAEGGCYPFSDGNYLIEWGADFVTIKYYSGTESEKPKLSSTWKTKEFHF